MATIRIDQPEHYFAVLVCTLDNGEEFRIFINNAYFIQYPVLHACTPEVARLVAEALLTAARLIEDANTLKVGSTVRILSSETHAKAIGRTGRIVAIRTVQPDKSQTETYQLYDVDLPDVFRRPVGFYAHELELTKG